MNKTPQAHIQTFSFSINHWDHLYSLQQAIQFQRQRTGRSLHIKGQVLNQPLLGHRDTPVSLIFRQVDEPPGYEVVTLTDAQEQYILSELCLENQQLQGEIEVDRAVFEELRRNLMEYGDIDGIHIVVTLGVMTTDETWPEGQSLKLLQLDYAMRGDA